MPSHELCFLRVYEIALQTGSDRKVPYYFSRNFLVPSLVLSLAAHRTCGVILVLVSIKCAFIDACVVFNVWYVEGEHDLLGLINTSWQGVPLWKKIIVQQFH